MLNLFRDRIKARGARGIIGLQRIFKIMDDDGSHTITLSEFTKACRDFRVGISDEYIPTLFNAFDINNDKTLSIDEFLLAIRGELNQTRLSVIEQAFRKLDKDNTGFIDL
jgi:Ca2+-binding EF-hand superfamily protein